MESILIYLTGTNVPSFETVFVFFLILLLQPQLQQLCGLCCWWIFGSEESPENTEKFARGDFDSATFAYKNTDEKAGSSGGGDSASSSDKVTNTTCTDRVFTLSGVQPETGIIFENRSAEIESFKAENAVNSSDSYAASDYDSGWPTSSTESKLHDKHFTPQPAPPPTGIHFDNFSKFAENVRQQQRQSTAENWSIVGTNNCTATTTISSQASSINKRKWKNEENVVVKLDDTKVYAHAKQYSKPKVLANTQHYNKIAFFVSPTQRDLSRRLNELWLQSIKLGDRTLNAPILGQSCRALKWIEIVRGTLLGMEEKGLVENATMTHLELQQCFNFLSDVQKFSRYPVDRVVSLAQKLLLLFPTTRPGKKLMPLGNYGNEKLVIGVDATPTHFGGYCVNLEENRIQFYAINAKDIPWKIFHKGHPDEFEMKNFMFALCLWHKQIEKYKGFSIYTDNTAILSKNKYSFIVHKLIGHFVRRENAQVCNAYENMYVNRSTRLDSFAKFIQPADDLSRGRMNKSAAFLSKFYGIPVENVKGTHHIQSDFRDHLGKADYIQKTDFHDEAIATVREFVNSLDYRFTYAGNTNQLTLPLLLLQDIGKLKSISSSTFSPDVAKEWTIVKRRGYRMHK